jgi:hypothetical protein
MTMATPQEFKTVPIRIKCEICGFVLGTVDPDKLREPIMGGMFESISPGQFPAPFPVTCEWMWIRCPMCRKRPFQFKDRVVMENGKVLYACRTIPTNRESETRPPDIVESDDEDQPAEIKDKVHVKKRKQ